MAAFTGLGGSFPAVWVATFTGIRTAAKGAFKLRLFLQGDQSDWDILSTLREKIYQWKHLFSEINLVVSDYYENRLSDVNKEDLWILSRIGIKSVIVDASRIAKHLVCQVLWNDKQLTFAISNAESGVINKNWLLDQESLLIYSKSYPEIPVKHYFDEDKLKLEKIQGDSEIEILDECNGPLNQFGKRFWQKLFEQHKDLQEHITHGDEIASISYSDRYLYSPWTILLVAEVIDGLRQLIGNSWSKPGIKIYSAPKSEADGYQKRGLFSDWLDDSMRSNVIESYFAAMDEKCEALVASTLQHGRYMEIIWQKGTKTIIRFDQGVSYWGCANKPPYFDNLSPIETQADDMINLVNRISVKNYKDFPTQIFVKERKL